MLRIGVLEPRTAVGDRLLPLPAGERWSKGHGLAISRASGGRWPTSTGLRIAVRIRRAVAAFEADLVRQLPLRPGHEEFRVEVDAAAFAGIELHHPAVEAAFVELGVDGAIERVGEIDAPAVAADLHHLRAAAE